jgi:prepilin-type N-terminal cleavage/methylation domain-containing protein
VFLKRYKQSCSDRAAFSLVEIAVVVTIIGILAALAVPYFKRVRENAIISTLENDLRIFSQEFRQYELNFGAYPDTSTSGTYPSGMADRISSAWTQSSVIGGTYRWVYASNNGNGGNNSNGNGNNGNGNNGNGNNGNGSGNLYAYIEITTNSSEPLRIDSTRLAEIDDDIDDGNTSSGNFQVSGMSLRYYLEQ